MCQHGLSQQIVPFSIPSVCPVEERDGSTPIVDMEQEIDVIKHCRSSHSFDALERNNGSASTHDVQAQIRM